jgi:preprotein translocase subunit SecE
LDDLIESFAQVAAMVAVAVVFAICISLLNGFGMVTP